MKKALWYIFSPATLVGLPSEDEVEKLLYDAYLNGSEVKISAVVHLERVEPKSIPPILAMTIRTRELQSSFHLEDPAPKYLPVLQDSSNAYLSNGFLSMQTALSLSFLEEVAPAVSSIVLLARPMPYPLFVNLVAITSLMIVNGLAVVCPLIVHLIVVEKASKITELMRIMGMKSATYWLSNFLVNYVQVGAVAGLLVLFYHLPLFGGKAFIAHVSPLVTATLMAVAAGAFVLFCFAISTVCPQPTMSIVVSLLAWIASYLPALVLFQGELLEYPYWAKTAVCLLPSMAFHMAFKIIAVFEEMGSRLEFSNLTSYPEEYGEDQFNLAVVLGSLCVSCLLYVFLIWYLGSVWPWQPGVNRPFYFCLLPLLPRKLTRTRLPSRDSSAQRLYAYFEPEPTDLGVGIKMDHVYKSFLDGFSTKAVLKDLSLRCYEGQITALLGHNGAGKTTAINVITGVHRPTAGSCEICGHDVVLDTAAARSALGYCPQQDILFPYLTVEQHLVFFAKLKNIPDEQLEDEIAAVLEKVKMLDKRRHLKDQLSGGMARKLSLAIALVGGSKVLILDEPTAGMDVEARRAFWDLVLDIRHGRTVLLTTHYMEEADALSDRLAVIAAGRLYCCGSPIFLKRAFGTGYRLRVALTEPDSEGAVQDAIIKSVPRARLNAVYPAEVVFDLGDAPVSQLLPLFDGLEAARSDGSLPVASFGVSIATMEDVFLKAGMLAEKENLAENSSEILSSRIYLKDPDEFTRYEEKDRLERLVYSVKGLLLKRWHYGKRFWISCVFQILAPVVFSYLMVRGVANLHILRKEKSGQLLQRTLDLSSIYGPTTSFFFTEPIAGLEGISDIYLDLLRKEMARIIPLDAEVNIAKQLGARARRNLRRFKTKMTIGGSLKGNAWYVRATAWYNYYAYHSIPISVNHMAVTLLRHYARHPNATITVVNRPLVRQEDSALNFGLRLHVELRMLIHIFLPVGLALLTSSYILFPVHERVAGAKLLQLMTGLHPAIFWAVHFLFDFFFYHLPASFLFVLFLYLFDGRHLFADKTDIIEAMFLILVLYGWSGIPFVYLLSFLFKSPSTGFVFTTIVCLVSGIIAPITVMLVDMVNQDGASYLFWVSLPFPLFLCSYSFASVAALAFINSRCKFVPLQKLARICSPESLDPDRVCCPGCIGEFCHRYISPFSLERRAAGQTLAKMAVLGLLYYLALVVTDSYRGRQPDEGPKAESGDSDVESERQRVLANLRDGTPDCLTVLGLAKNFKAFRAVRGLTFGVRPNECFGLLGVNGAGKTTTFRMLIGDLVPTTGNAFIQNSTLVADPRKFKSYIGYVPQKDALLDKLTGPEMLELFARLRGVSEGQVPSLVAWVFSQVDLEGHERTVTSVYSGGMRRKLSLGLAVIGLPPLVFLDEPTVSVDPVSRRKLWASLIQLRQSAGLTFVLTSHSMEECEALCTRVAILTAGQFQCIGSLQHLKAKYGRDFTLYVKGSERQPAEGDVLNTALEKAFPGILLRDRHQGYLEYTLSHSSGVRWSQIFKTMEDIKLEYRLEHYYISDSSLEQIFLSFAAMKGGRL